MQHLVWLIIVNSTSPSTNQNDTMNTTELQDICFGKETIIVFT